MNLINSQFIKFKNRGITVKKEKGKLILSNNTDRHGFLVIPKFFSGKKIKSVSARIGGEIIKGNGAILQILNLGREILSETSFNSASTYTVNTKKFFFAIKIFCRSEVVIDLMEAQLSDNVTAPTEALFGHLVNSENDILIITPSYPTEENKYFGGFVHSRVKAYKKAGIGFDLVCAHIYPNTCRYTFEGIDVTRTDFLGLRQILLAKKYKTILLHFFDEKYAQVLDACDMSGTSLYFWVHGPETLYWDWSKMTDRYFEPETPLSTWQVNKFKMLDKLIARYNDKPNVHWVFVSQWIKNHSENLIGLSFKNSVVIPNIIDEQNFSFAAKDPELRKKVFILRRFENISKYAMDINVRTILELSRRACFKDMEFNIYGTGEYYDTIIEPLRGFENVKLYQQFLSHQDIAQVHKQNGIGLFATRYDAQGVSMCEAAMSGLAIVSSKNDAIAEFLPGEEGILCDTENPVAYADVIEKMYNEPEYFARVSEACHSKVIEKCCFEQTIDKEIELIGSIFEAKTNFIKPENSEDKLLTVIIPSYNVSSYLAHGVDTMLDHGNAGKMEIIVVNDGSKDSTVDIAKGLAEKYGEGVIRIIDKPNGGHGSTINAGLKIATGKYIRIIDGDDWVNSKDMCRLIDCLAEEDADIVVTDYCEDRAQNCELIEKKLYTFMQAGKKYRFEDLCYEGYGFNEWGPILATANFRKEVLVGAFTLTEKSFYIDMEFDAFSIERANTIVYYPLDIYRYFIGRVDQSISEASYKRNFKQHEGVIFNLINYYYSADISEGKKRYILNKLILPMIVAHYVILIQFLKSGKEYKRFEKKLSQYPYIYGHPLIATRMKRIHRKTGGLFVRYDGVIKRIAHKLIGG